MRNALVLGVLAVVLAFVAWIAFSTDDAPRKALEPHSGTVVEPPPSSDPNATVSVPTTGEPVERTEAPESEGVAAHQLEKLLELTGTLVLLADDGSEQRDVSGSFRLMSWRGNGAKAEQITVEHGTWTVRLAELRFAELDRFEIAAVEIKSAAAALVRPTERFAKSELQGLEIVARVRPPSTLRVVDRATGVDLDKLEIVRGAAGINDDPHPGTQYDARVLERAGRSPLDIDALERRGAVAFELASYVIRAPGYAWGSVQIDRRVGGALVLALERGGELEIVLRGAKPPSEARLRLRESVDAPLRPVIDEELVGRDHLLIEGLHPGKYEVEVSLGAWTRPGARYGSTECGLDAGQREQVVLDLEAIASAEYAAVDGFVLVPDAWHAEPISVFFKFQGDALQGQSPRVQVSTAPGPAASPGYTAFRFLAPKLQVGSYLADIDGYGVSIPLEVPPGGLSNCTLEIQAPVEVRLDVVDDVGGERIAAATLHWSVFNDTGKFGGGLYELAMQASTDAPFVVRAPAGGLQVMCSAEGYEFQHAILTVALPGPAEHTLRMKRSCGIALSLYDGETRLVFSDGFEAEVRAVDHDGTVNSWTSGVFVRAYTLSQPGAYRVSIPQVPGYAATPDQDVLVEPHKTFALDLKLRREHP